MTDRRAKLTLPTDERILIEREFDAPAHLVYRAFTEAERIVATETFEGVPDGYSEQDATTINTTTFAEVGGRTRLTLLIEAANRTARDAIIASGMEDALRLAEQVALTLA